MRFLGFILSFAIACAQSTPIKVDVRLVRLLVNVKNPAGELVGTLDQNEFTVYDCGVKQEVKVFDRQTEQPLSVAVMIDASGSTIQELKYETTSVGKFLKALLKAGNPKDVAALYSFNYEVRELHPFTRNLRKLEDSLGGIHATAGTSLYDAIFLIGRALA